MSDVVSTEVVEEQSQGEADALASMLVGYNARGPKTGLPADQSSEVQPTEAPTAAPEVPGDAPREESRPDQQSTAATQSIEDRLAAIKEEIRAVAAAQDPGTVRKMYGEIGNITRKLKAMEPTQAPAPAPVDDELTAAIARAEKAAEEFPEVAGPLVDALKIASKQKAMPTGVSQMTPESVTAIMQAREQQSAIELLAEEHPDFETVRATPEFLAWEQSKPVEYREKLWNTWNPLVVSKALTEFKSSQQESQRAQQKKQNRLAGAVTPQGVTAPPAPSKLPDEQGLWVGYNKGINRPLNKR